MNISGDSPIKIYKASLWSKSGTVLSPVNSGDTITINDLFNNTPADHGYSGLIFTGIAGENLAIGNVCYLDTTTGYWKKALADAAATMIGRAVATGTINSGASGAFLRYGYLRDDSWTNLITQTKVDAAPGLNDGTYAGTYTGSGVAIFEVEIDASVPTPDTFKWRKNGGAYTAGVPCALAATALSDGITIAFGAVDGHTIGDKWTYNIPIVGNLYVSAGTAGLITPSIPAVSTNLVQLIGFAVAPRIMFIDMDSTYVEVA
jgi:hypothetical protein